MAKSSNRGPGSWSAALQEHNFAAMAANIHHLCRGILSWPLALAFLLVVTLVPMIQAEPSPQAQPSPNSSSSNNSDAKTSEDYRQMITEREQIESIVQDERGRLQWYRDQIPWLEKIQKKQMQINDILGKKQRTAADDSLERSLEDEKASLFQASDLPTKGYHVDSVGDQKKIEDLLFEYQHEADGLAKKLATDVSKENEATDRLNNYLNVDKAKQDFKKTISIYFSLLIALVIVGFFVLAFQDAVVRRDIFSGQTGLQFVTLFAIVIAIILFGITGVLEGKELSALLGGLSGYILGRTSTQPATAHTGQTAAPNTGQTAAPNTGQTAAPNTGQTAAPSTAQSAADLPAGPPKAI